ncbi:MAG: DVU0150 family protein [Acidobacteriota bacterium]
MRNRLAALALLVAAMAQAAGAKAEPIVIVADSRGFSGWQAWWTNLYNESHVLSALATVLIIPSVALVLGKATDLLMGRIGINLRSRELAEH